MNTSEHWCPVCDETFLEWAERHGDLVLECPACGVCLDEQTVEEAELRVAQECWLSGQDDAAYDD